MPKSEDNGRFVSRNHSTTHEASTKARTDKTKEVAEEVRKSRGSFDRDKFDKFVDSNPLLSNLHLLSETDD